MGVEISDVWHLLRAVGGSKPPWREGGAVEVWRVDDEAFVALIEIPLYEGWRQTGNVYRLAVAAVAGGDIQYHRLGFGTVVRPEDQAYYLNVSSMPDGTIEVVWWERNWRGPLREVTVVNRPDWANETRIGWITTAMSKSHALVVTQTVVHRPKKHVVVIEARTATGVVMVAAANLGGWKELGVVPGITAVEVIDDQLVVDYGGASDIRVPLDEIK